MDERGRRRRERRCVIESADWLDFGGCGRVQGGI